MTKRKTETIGRRGFLKAGAKLLPAFAMIGLAATAAGCGSALMCHGDCTSSCISGCANLCTGGCRYHCGTGCTDSCSGTCSGSCSGDCRGSCSNHQR